MIKDFKEIEKLLLSKHSVIKKNGFDFLYPVLEKLGNPHKNLGKVIHITGTNGKGSVAYLMASILKNSGYKTALYISPHIESIFERIQINGEKISEKDFVRIFNIVYEYSQKLSFFEIMTLIAFYYFAEKNVDFSVIEVGIGGLYDTTNLIEKKEICFITSVNYDHKNILGNTLEEIAYQKAGIIKNGSICLCPQFDKSVKNVILETARKNNGKVYFIRDFHKIEKVYPEKNQMLLKNKISGESYKIGIMGIKQTLNISLVKKAIEILNEKGYKISKKAFKNGIQNLKIHSRFEVLTLKSKGEKKYFIIDGAHNPEAIMSFTKMLDFIKIKNPVFVFSMLIGKDYNEVLKLIEPKAKKIIFTKINSNKALEPYILADEYQKLNPKADVSVISETSEALIAAMNSSKYICVCGSFYLASEALKTLKEKMGVK